MKKTFQKTLIATALAAASVAAFAGTPATTNLLFPYITTETGAYTFVSISNRGNGVAGNGNMHFTYAMKPTSATAGTSCSHLDGDATATPNDLMQFEISNRINLITASGDTTSTPKYYPNTAAAANQRGFLIVNNDTAADGTYGTATTYGNNALYGEARIINTLTGLAFGYSTDDLHTTGAANPNFAAAAGPDGAVTTKVISWFPDPTVSTSWYTLPLGTEAAMAFGAASLSTTAQVRDNLGVSGGHYNNNEAFQSSIDTASATC